MGKKTSTFDYKTLASFLLPDGILDFFDVTGVSEEHTGKYAETGAEKIKLHIYLDERDTHSDEWHDLKPNGFTESREVTDFPVRDRKVILHVRRRRWIDSEGHNVVLNRYDLVANGTSYSKEFADVLKKKYLDTYPVTARSVAQIYKIDGRQLEWAYKDCLSGFKDWDQVDHAAEWVLLPENMGDCLSIDETLLHEDLRTFVSNKAGHGKHGTLVASVSGTKASDVIKVLMQIPEEKRLAVKEVTMDFSDSMYTIATKAFAEIVVDCFHIIKRCTDAVEEVRLREKREAIKEQNKQKTEHRKKLEKRAKRRKYYRKNHLKNYKGKKRGRKPMRLNQRFKPEELSNGDTHVELLTRSRYLLTQSGDKWGEKQRERANLLFDMHPKIKEAYGHVCSLRAIFRDKSLNKETARVKLHEWYQRVANSNLREIKVARDAIKYREEEVLNYFNNRSTNASAESLNSKTKGFRAQVRGVQDLSFFMYRVATIFG